MPPDLIEDILAFLCVTGGESKTRTEENVCEECGADLVENDCGEFFCPECEGDPRGTSP